MSRDQERVVALVAVAVVAALVALVWATGALAGLIFSGSPGTVPGTDAIEVAFRLPAHLGDPRLAASRRTSWTAGAGRDVRGADGGARRARCRRPSGRPAS